MLLLADENQPDGAWKDADIARALRAGTRTVERVREACVKTGLEAALNHTRPKKMRSKVLDGAAEARLAQLACSVKSGMKSPLFRGLKRPLISGKNVRWTGGGGCFRIR